MVSPRVSFQPLPAAASLRGSLASGGTADGSFRGASARGGCGGCALLQVAWDDSVGAKLLGETQSVQWGCRRGRGQVHALRPTAESMERGKRRFFGSAHNRGCVVHRGVFLKVLGLTGWRL